MSQSLSQQLQRSRFNKLRLKRNKIYDKKDDSPSLIVIDESFDVSNTEMHKKLNQPQIVFSPIVINDSSELSKSNTLHDSDMKTPSKSGNTSFNCSKTDQSKSNLNPSEQGWSPAQDIITATPRTPTIPTTPKDKLNESLEQCSLKRIEMSHKKLLDELYGNVWKSIPKLFKEKQPQEYGQVQKKLNFFDEEDKENVRQDLAENKKLYLTDSNPKHKTKSYDVEGKSKKKLYTEKVPSTPDPVAKPKIKRAAQTTTKKIKGKSVTEIVELMKDKFVIERKEENTVKRLTFVGSLADNVPSWRCHIEAIKFIDNFKTLKQDLTKKLFVEFNSNIFGNGLDADMQVLWDTKLRSTAGTTTNRLIKTTSGTKIRCSSIKLSTKVVDGPQRLRDTLVHELCHAATWVIDEELKAGHGPLWKKWARKALKVYPELGDISRCHNMEIHFKYTYKCTKCGYMIQRHSKSIDITKKCCGYCHGKFEIILNKKNKDGVVVSTPARQGAANDFAQFVKENYGNVKKGKTHAQVMKELGEQFSAKKKDL